MAPATANDRCTVVLEGILQKKRRTGEEKRLAELFTLLIEAYEQQRYALSRTAGPVDVLRHLMDANELRHVDLLDVFGAASFRLSPELFF
jgi:antitoxin component HigA of HigAB toxin-antitoxin module